jgi:predicted phage terminase large subunit-like protein
VLAPTSNDLKHTCIEGESGLLACIPEELVADYNKQDHLVTLVNGSTIRGISADSYERLRGPQFHYAWCDELAAMQYLGAGEAWDMMMMGLRLGDQPRVIVTTTPRPKDLILDLVGREGEDVIVDRASTYANKDNLAKTFSDQLEQYRGTKLYQQEVLGEIVDLEDGKVVSRDMFRLWPAGKEFPDFEYIVQSYDTAYTDKTYNDPSAMTTWGVFKPLDGPLAVLLIDCWAEHLTFPDLKPKVINEWQTSYGDGKKKKRPDLIIVEGKASGKSLVQELRAMHLPVHEWNPGNADKMTRLQITASIFATKRVWLPESETRKGYVKDWCEGFLSQICSFPDSAHDDYVDSTTQAIRYLKDIGYLDINPEPRYDDEDDYVDAQPKRVNPYAI